MTTADIITEDVTATPETRFAETARGRIAYQDVGEGPAVVLIHGGGAGAYGYSNYRKNIFPLAERGNRVLVIDLPGYGQTEMRVSDSGMFGATSGAVLDLLDYLSIETASLVGNSLGGGTALKLALDHPNRIAKLILMGPAGSLATTSAFPTEGLIRMLTFYDGEGPSLQKLDRMIDLLVYDRSSITQELINERFETATLPQTLKNPPLKGATVDRRNDLWRENLEAITHPTLIIWGQEDRVLPLDMAFLLLKRLPNADLHVFSKCGHWAQWERADEFNGIVADFVAK